MPPDLKTNLPEGPMPTNVKNFKLIELSYFDESVANFLRQFQREQPGNSLLDNVNFCFSSSLSPQPQDNTIIHILDQLMPMIDNINSMSICHLDHMEFGSAGLGPNNAASQLLTKARILQIHNDMQMSTFAWCDWLNTPRDDGKPRVLRLISVSFTNTKNLIEQIRKDFSNATLPVSFFVDVRVQEFWDGNVNWQDICLDNGQKERLVVKTSDPTPMGLFQYLSVLISRYPVEANQEWKANEREIVEWKFLEQNRLIRFD